MRNNLMAWLPIWTPTIEIDCRQRLVVHGVSSPPFSCRRNRSPTPVRILPPRLMLFPDRGFCLFYSGNSKFFSGGSVVYRVEGTPLVRLIFQRGPGPIQNFNINAFRFMLMQSVPEEDIFVYHVTNGDFCMLIFSLGVDTSYSCDYRSSMDFVHLIRENLERFSIRKYAITLLLSEDAPTPPRLPYTSPTDTRLLCLKYCRAASDGWRDSRGCDACVTDYWLSLQPLSSCRQPYPCNCIICRWQPPSLRDLCSWVVFHDVARFELTVNTTFDQYVYAVKSNRVPLLKLLPPKYPFIRLWFRFDSFQHKLHRDCPVVGPWHAEFWWLWLSRTRNKRVHFGATIVTKVSFYLKPVRNIRITKSALAAITHFPASYLSFLPFIY